VRGAEKKRAVEFSMRVIADSVNYQRTTMAQDREA